MNLIAIILLSILFTLLAISFELHTLTERLI